MQEERSYKDKKVISIGTVSELTGLSVRQIRYYEERQLISPERSSKGTRKYSFSDVERLMNIADLREEGVQTTEILKDIRKKEEKSKNPAQLRKKMLQGQLNAHFQYKHNG
ncbi:MULTISPECIES: MerR family transcriptional regulator [Bacillaceae]|uniref:MerR family transcriptional regulator n=1 Tax=Metabacillus sediminis TaxID=3117746 RepID=A0ABZ2NKE8_9BACI|nr:MerR family transcriptional regulator [Bacillus sp. SJS]KZZ83580.1 MerR family transcriptional regulator [Bacillus sp. SJS]